VSLPSTLVVDDDATIASALRTALGNHKVSVTIAPDAATAKQLLGKEQFCGIVLDLMLEGSNGRDVLDYMAAEHMNIPTVVVSRRLPPSVRESLDEDQVKLCFAKPIEPRLLATIVLSLCGVET
jgi:CheY-like chemotaxis protein